MRKFRHQEKSMRVVDEKLVFNKINVGLNKNSFMYVPA